MTSVNATTAGVAAAAGVAGMLALETRASAGVGVAISVTTIPAAANIGIAAALGDWHNWGGAMLQLTVNLAMIVIAGVSTLFLQRRLYLRRRLAHLHHEAREVAGLPLGRSRRVGSATYQRPE